MDQIGASVPRRFAALEETAIALRQLLDGETVTTHGTHVKLDGVTLGFPPEHAPPIFLGTTGPTGLRITGRSSDGVLLPELATPDAIRWAHREMAAAGGSAEVLLLTMTSISDDRAAALDHVRARVQGLIDLRVYDNLTDIAGLGADGSGPLTDEILQSLAIGGTPEDAARTVTNWAEAGADRVVIVAGDDDPEESYRRFAAEVFPLLGR
jgi:alkanesulfonate monooxygenase SsuD/methylene tetrahydromethanopterin reductase-like flavin-dependent oxidoreductase (luciferase family)